MRKNDENKNNKPKTSVQSENKEVCLITAINYQTVHTIHH